MFAKERIKRKIMKSSLFDEEWYKAQYHVSGDAWEHYNSVGYSLGFDPSEKFSTSRYNKENLDVYSQHINPLLHYVLAGCEEGRKIYPSEIMYIRYIENSALFDVEWYRKIYGLTESDNPYLHYLTKSATCYYIDPSPWFSNESYLKDNNDVEDLHMNPLLHYEMYGRSEKRRIFNSIVEIIRKGKLFDVEWYRNMYMQNQTEHPIVHYLRQGHKENNKISENIDDRLYMELLKGPNVKAESEIEKNGYAPLFDYYINGYEHAWYADMPSVINNIKEKDKEVVTAGKELDIKIFLPCNQKSYIPPNSLFYPVQTGCEAASQIYEDMIRDDTGDNISERNFSYCELSAQYWAWKNMKADYYGFFHNRRYFVFNEKEFYVNEEQLIPMNGLYDAELERIGVNEDIMRNVIKDYDIIVPKPVNVAMFSCYDRKPTVRNQFVTMPGMVKEDFDVAMEYILENHPEYKPTIDYFMDNNSMGYYRLMYIMKNKLFNQYCEWLYPILNAVYVHTDFSEYGIYEQRSVGMIAERLFGLWFVHQKLHSDITYKELPCAFFPSIKDDNLKRAYDNLDCAIVMPIDDACAGYSAVTLESILEKADNGCYYDVIFVARAVHNKTKSLIQGMATSYDNVSIRFIDIGDIYPDLFVNQIKGKNPLDYYQLMLPYMLLNYKRVICLTYLCMVKQDISALYKVELNDNALGAVRDSIVSGMVKMEYTESDSLYIKRVLQLKNPFDYFNTNVLIMDLEKIRECVPWTELVELVQVQQWKYAQQDIWNVLLEENVAYIDERWNVISQNYSQNILNPAYYAPAHIFTNFINSKKEPYIITECKGSLVTEDFYDDFWAYAKNTPFYNFLLKYTF